jgi:hypothetical protein
MTKTTQWVPKSLGTSSGGAVLYSDSFTSDAVGSVPAGWSVAGVNAGLSVATGDATHSHVYAHDGWSATTSAGNGAWTNYTLSVAVQPSAWLSEQDCIDVRYVDATDHYAVCFVGGTEMAFLKVAASGTTVLSEVSLDYSSTWHQLSITAAGSTFTVSLNGQELMTVSDSTFCRGAVGFDVNAPVEFDSVSVMFL